MPEHTEAQKPLDPDGVRVVVTAAGVIYGEDTPEARQLARRIQACVNACEGIPTEELEKGVVQDMRRLIELVAPLLPESSTD